MLLHSRLNPQVLDHLTLDLYSSEFGLVAVSLSTGSKFKTKRWLSKFFDGVSVYEAEVDHDLYMAQLLEYFNGSRRIFEFPVDLRGTDFQKKVYWRQSSVKQKGHSIAISNHQSSSQLVNFFGKKKWCEL